MTHKRLKLKGAAIAFLLIGLVAGVAKAERKIKSEIIINSDIQSVWQIFTNTQSYPEWSPFIRSIKGDLIEGEKITVFLQPPGDDGMEFNPILLSVKPNKELRWQGKLLFNGLFDGEHYFTFESLNDGTTRVTHGETFQGLLAPIVFPMIEESTIKGFNQYNQALKKRAEKLTD